MQYGWYTKNPYKHNDNWNEMNYHDLFLMLSLCEAFKRFTTKIILLRNYWFYLISTALFKLVCLYEVPDQLIWIVFPQLTCAISPTTSSALLTWMASPFLMTLNVCSPSIRSCRPRNCRSLDQSLNAVTITTITTAIKMAAPSIHAWCSSSSGSSVIMI